MSDTLPQLSWTPSRWSQNTHYAIVDDGFYATRPHRGPFGDRWELVYYPDTWGDSCRKLLGREHTSLEAAQEAAETHRNTTSTLGVN